MSSPVKCNSHNRPVIVFCMDCGVALCDNCLSSKAHHSHQYSSLPEACQKQMDDLAKKTKELEKNMRKRGHVPSPTSANGILEVRKSDNFTKSKEKIDKLYNELEEMLEGNKSKALRLLDAMQEHLKAKLTCVERSGEKVQRDVAEIRETVQQLQDQVDQDSADVLVSVSLWEHPKHMCVNWEHNYKFSNIRLTSLENSVHAILAKSKAFLPCPWEFAEFITFDKNTAPEMLKVSEDNRQVTIPASNSLARKQPNKSQDSFLNVQAEQSFSTGQHYWEVDVRECHSWAAGVVVEGQLDQASSLGHDQLSWILESDAGVLSAAHNGDSSAVIEEDLSLLGIFLDCHSKRLRFYNVVTGAVLHTFPVRCGQTVRPVFSIAPLDDRSSCLVLCDLHRESTERPESSPDSASPQQPPSDPIPALSIPAVRGA
ncbi:hypothetical protein ACEWY4_018608 [Coilia grayii]|uniref:Uncharacterized protein n=1 Tax=Coilia grayii TaxID=363190 RepID=A0ABD1JDQ1_9TELE